jgi:FkbM family methyltransferase
MSEILQWAMGQCGRPVRGVLHIGANTGQEAGYYATLGLKKVVWIEGDPHLFETLQETLVSFAGQMAYLCLASDVDGQLVDFHIASNDGGSSSILRLDASKFAKECPGIKEVKSVRLRTCRLDTLFARQGCDLSEVNLIVADVQGYELPVLRGLGSLIKGFDAIVSELNFAPIYQGATKPYDLESFLVSQGFRRLWLGISDVQATGIWIGGNVGPLRRLYMALTVRLYYVAARCGLVKALRAVGILGAGRRIYYAIKRRAA